MSVSCSHLATLLVAAVALLGCGNGSDDTSDSSGDDNPDASADTGGGAEDVVTATLGIPSDFDGAVVLVAANFFETAVPAGMPAGMGDRIEDPEIVAGESFAITSPQAGLEGDYYLSAVVYCEGGGNGMTPMAGVDWVGVSDHALTLGPGTGTVDAGLIPVILAE